MRKNVFTIIVTHNGERWIKDTIQSLFKSIYSYSIVVVDNGSSDKTLKILSEFKEIKLIENQLNLGFGQANNIGIKYSQKKKADYIFLLNQDAKVERDTISDLVNVLEKNKNFGIISPLHYDGETSIKMILILENILMSISGKKNYMKLNLLMLQLG